MFSPDESALGRTFDLDGTKWLFGRDSPGRDRIADPRISRRHLDVAPGPLPAFYVATDLDSGNGTYVNGVRLEEPRTLEAGQVISLGDTLLVVDQDVPSDRLPAGDVAVVEPIEELVGWSLAAERMRRSISAVARAGGSVLLLGPTGAGKEVAARAIHRLSGRRGPFVPVNCAAIPAEIAEAEFFGYRKGAFTGAQADRAGFFEQSDEGTLFLDEVGDLPAPLQAKLLRVLEDRVVTPLGGGPSRQLDLHVVAATLADIQASGFRMDLLARLGDWTLHLPPLAERRSDILPLWRQFVGMERGFTAELAEALLLHGWVMNVRELRKLAHRVTTLAGPGETLDLQMLPDAMQAPLRARLDADAESELPEEDGELAGPGRAVLESALKATRGNVKKIAEANGWHRTQLYRWIRRAGLDPSDYR